MLRQHPKSDDDTVAYSNCVLVVRAHKVQTVI